jgi:hypothetical protein
MQVVSPVLPSQRLWTSVEKRALWVFIVVLLVTLPKGAEAADDDLLSSESHRLTFATAAFTKKQVKFYMLVEEMGR